MYRAILLVVLFKTADFGKTSNQKKLNYEESLNSSLILDKDDRRLLETWTIDFQVKRVNIATKYRLEMTRHKEHSFRRSDNNAKWAGCVYRMRGLIRKLEKDYYADESECLTTTTAGDGEKKLAVDQIAKEMRKWRKGYRYLVKTCSIENPGDTESADICLIQYMEKDNYNQVIQRLIILKLQAMGELYLQLETSLRDLDECLNSQLSTYLGKGRSLVSSHSGFSVVDSSSRMRRRARLSPLLDWSDGAGITLDYNNIG